MRSAFPNLSIASSDAFNTVTAIRRNAPLVLAPKIGLVPETAQKHNLKRPAVCRSVARIGKGISIVGGPEFCEALLSG
jgi:hypothetical protein